MHTISGIGTRKPASVMMTLLSVESFHSEDLLLETNAEAPTRAGMKILEPVKPEIGKVCC